MAISASLGFTSGLSRFILTVDSDTAMCGISDSRQTTEAFAIKSDQMWRVKANINIASLTIGVMDQPTSNPGTSAICISRAIGMLCVVILFTSLSTAASAQEGGRKPTRADLDALKKDLKGNREVRIGAALRLAKLGISAREALPDLLQTMIAACAAGDDDTTEVMGLAITEIAPPGYVFDCIDSLRDGPKNEQVRVPLNRLILKLYRPGDELIDNALGGLFCTSGDPVRVELAHNFLIAHPIQSAIPGLLLMLKDDNPEVQNAACVALCNYGPEAAAALPLLLRHTKGRTRVHIFDINAAAAVGRDNKELSFLFRELIRDNSQESSRRAAAIRGLRKSKYAELGIPDLLSLAESEVKRETVLAHAALESLSLMPLGRSETQRLIRIFEVVDTQDDAGCVYSARAISKAGEHGKEAIPLLLKRLRNSNLIERASVQDAYRNALINILGRDGAAARLERLKEDPTLVGSDVIVVEDMIRAITKVKNRK